MTYIPTANPYRERFAFLPRGWDDGWRAAKAAALAASPTPARVWFTGSSITQGYGVTDANATSWRWKLRNRMVALLGQGADYSPLSQSRGETTSTGTATSGSGTTLVNSGAPFTASALIGMYCYIESGPGAGQYRQISANTTTTVTVAAWSGTIGNAAAGSVYHIGHFLDGYEPRSKEGHLWLNAPWKIGSATVRSWPATFAAGGPFNGPFGALLPEVPLQGMPGMASWAAGPVLDQLLATYRNPAALGNCTDYDILWHHRNSTANNPAFKFAVDGGAKTSVNNHGSDDLLNEIETIRGLSNAVHDIQLYMGHASAQNWIGGVVAFKSLVAGVQVAHFALGVGKLGTASLDYYTNFLLGKDVAGVVGASPFPMCPDLIITDWSLSEMSFASPDQYRLRMALFIEAVRRVKPNCSIIMVRPFYPNGITSDDPPVLPVLPLAYEGYMEAMRGLAERYHCAMFDVHSRWDGRTNALGYLDPSPELIHPNQAGQDDIDAWIGPFL